MTGSGTHYQIQPRNEGTYHYHHGSDITQIHAQQSGVSRLQIEVLTGETGTLHHLVFAHSQFFRRACGTRSMDGHGRRVTEPFVQKKI